jgi:hypothetical protein
MYVDYYPIEAITAGLVTIDDDIVDIRRAKRLTPIRDLVPRGTAVQKMHHRCYLHKGSFDNSHAVCKHCGVTYCLPCAKQLLELDESCWACGLPLDLDITMPNVPTLETVH